MLSSAAMDTVTGIKSLAMLWHKKVGMLEFIHKQLHCRSASPRVYSRKEAELAYCYTITVTVSLNHCTVKRVELTKILMVSSGCASSEDR